VDKVSLVALGAAIACVAAPLAGKPIAFADGTTTMVELDSNTREAQAFYAPRHWWSLGFAAARMQDDARTKRHDVEYAQVNFLVRRWNFEHAQGNLFVSAGVGSAQTREAMRDRNGIEREQRWRGGVRRLTVQGDYETRTFYTSFKSDLHRASRFIDRADQAQIGFSPRAHDYDDLAVWFVGQVRKYRGMDDKTEGGAFVRLFRGPFWVEIGAAERRKGTFMMMYNF
jgi:hypothetical protein